MIERTDSASAARDDDGAADIHAEADFPLEFDTEIPAADRSRPLPASDAQLGIWFFETYAKESPSAYHIPTLVRLRGRLDPAALESAVNALTQRYEILRCGVAEEGGEITLRLRPPFEVRLIVEPIEEGLIAEKIASLTTVPFSLAEGPLVRFALFKTAPDDHHLLILQHHLISDGWSVGLLVRELFDTYVRHAKGERCEPAVPLLQYADYAAFSRTPCGQEPIAEATDYWVEKLSGVPVIELPTDHPRPPKPSHRGRHYHFRLPADLVAQIRSFARGNRTTPYAVLFTAHALLLARYSGQKDFVVAMPVDGRVRPELVEMLGCFSNLLPVRCRVDPAESFTDAVSRTFDDLLEGATYQAAPFHRIVAALGGADGARETVLAKVFRCLFVLDSFNKDLKFETDGLTADIIVEADQTIVKADLGFAMQEVGEEIAVKIEYALDLFEEDTIRRMAGHFTQLIAAGLAAPASPVGRLPLLSAGEFRDLVITRNETGSLFPRERSLADLFEDAAARFAEHPAYVEGGLSVSYATLDRRAGQFASALVAAGLEPGGRVGILLDRGLDGLIAILATIKAGAIYVPVDPTYPRERIDMILDDAGVRIVVTDEAGCAGATDGRIKLFVPPDAGEQSAPLPRGQRAASDIAYICYTSGTTGRPRGVIISDRAVNRLVFETNYLAYRPHLRIGFASNLVFDGATLEIWGTLLHGGCLVHVPRASLLDVDQLSDLLRVQNIDVIILTAALFHRFAEERPDAFSGMEAVLTGGAVVNPAAVARVLGSGGPPRSVQNCYGPTETTTFAATYRMVPGDVIDETRPLPIGQAIANTRLYIVDALNEPVPVGIPGELLIGGDGVAEGYLNREDLNAVKFIALSLTHPAEPGTIVTDRVYRSGDLVKWRADGLIEFIGRADRQIKLRGFRVEPGEIEAAILMHSDITDAIVIPRESGADLRLDAYYSGEAAPRIEALKVFLAERLPAYMIPHRFRRLEAMPVNVAGKIDVAALPESLEEVTATPAIVSGALSPIATDLTRIIADVLACPEPGPDADFFALGGDSIQSIRVAGRARDRGYGLTVRDIFEHRTIARMAALLAERAPSAQPVSSDNERAEIVLMPIQHAFFDLDLADRNHFNLAVLLKADGRLDPARMEVCVNAMVAAHEALRSRWPLKADGSERRQIILPAREAGEIKLARYRLGELPGTIKTQIEAICTDWQTGFDIETGPIFAAGIIENHPDGCDRLFLAAHHLAIDIVSWFVLIEHLKKAYESKGEDERAARDAGSLQRFSHALDGRANAPETLRELPHWIDAASGPRHLATEIDRPEAFRLERKRRTDGALFDRAVAACDALLGLRPHEVMIAAAALALALEAKERDITVAVEGHGREHSIADLSRTIGWFTALYPCRMVLPDHLDEDESLLVAFAEIKDALRATPNLGLGFGLLKYMSTDESARAALEQWSPADLSVNYLGGFDVAAGDWRLESDAPGTTVSTLNRPPHRLDVTAFRSEGEFVIALVADGRRVAPAFTDSFCDRMLGVLARLAALSSRPKAPLVTASDHPLSGLDRKTLTRLLGRDGSGDRKVLRLTPVEEGMLFEALRRPESNAYTIQIHWRHQGDLDSERLKAAFESLVDRHEALRCWFVVTDVPHPVRVVEPRSEFGWRVFDWRGLDQGAQAKARTQFLDEDRRKAFDLTRAGGLRVAVIRRDDDDWEIFWTIHHIYFDGWSVSILLTELAEAYDQLAVGKTIEVDAPPLFDAFLAHLIETDEAASRAFWSQQLSTFSEAADLPFRRPGGRLDVPGPDGASVRISVPIPPQLAADVEILSARHAITQSTSFQFAWALLLARCARTDDVVLGTTVSGRTAPVAGIENMVGLAISTVPVRLIMDDRSSSLDMIRKLHATLTGIEEHSHVPLTDLQRLSAVPVGERLFHSLFVFENYPWHRLAAGGQLQFEDLELLDKTEMPLTILVILKDRPRFEVAFDPTLYSSEGVELLCGHILIVLQKIIADPEARIGDLDIIAPAERFDLVSTWNATKHDLDLNRTVLDLVAESIAARPESIAVSHRTDHLTYRALGEASTRLAQNIRRRYRGLRQAQMPPEIIIPIVLERGLGMITSMLAVLKAGGAYLPIDPDDPLERITFMLDDANAPLLLADQATARRRGLDEAFTDRLILVEEDEAGGEDEPLPRVGPRDLAYVIYTSGSTGRPKGTLIEHRGLVNRLAWVQGDYFPITHDDRVLQKTPYTFDVSIWELFWPLVQGARLIFADPGGHRDPAYLHRLIRDQAITIVHFVPSMLQVFVEHPGLAELSGLRLIAASGEGLPTRLVSRVLAALPNVTMINLYGPTEGTIEVSGHICSAKDEDEAKVAPVGRPGWNIELHVLDPAGRLLPVGIPGELHIGGVQLARGYLNRPDLTAERFVENQHGLGRLYRTGDLVRRRPDGIIDYLGRIDFQMKIRGMRVEPGEIETALLTCAGIGQACVIAEDRDNHGELIAYVTAKGPVESDALRAHLAGVLPAHMVPARIVRLEALPLTVSGKVDRLRLSRLAKSGETGARPSASEVVLSSTEALVAGVYADVLKAGGHVDPDLSFFALGGHSLTAMRVAMRLSERLGLEVPVRLIFEHASVRDMAKALEDLAPQTGLTKPLTRAARTNRLEPSFAQARVLFLESFAEAPGLYLVPAAMRIKGDFNDAAFARAAASLIEAHEILRTRYGFAESAPAMWVAESGNLDLKIFETDREALQVHLHVEANTGFALDRDPPIRFRLFRLSPTERVLVISLHHVVIDGWSLDILLADLARRYDEERLGIAGSEPEEGLTYLDFAAWQRNAMAGEGARELSLYWSERLKDASVLDLPTDRPRPPVATYRGATASFALSRADTEDLEQFCGRSGSTLFPLLLAAWSIVLSRYCGQADLVIGTPIASRTLPQTEPMIGLFQNTIPLRVRLKDDEAVVSLVSRLAREVTEDFARQDLPFQLMIEALGLDRDPSRAPLFQAMLILDGGDPTRSAFTPQDVVVMPIVLGSDTAKVDLTAAFARTIEGLTCTIEYASDLFVPATMERLCGHLQSVLSGLASDPFQLVGDLDILLPQERADLLERFNATAHPVDGKKTILDLIAQQVDARPNAVAVAHGAQRMSYRALDEASSALARTIRDRHREIQGVDMPPEAVVALVMDRGCQMIIAILAAMKAGGAYLPISPDEPRDRAAFMLEDAGAVIIVSESAWSEREALAACPPQKLIMADQASGALDEKLPNIASKQLAYVIYTSGSTGRPKAVPIEHRSLHNRMAWVQGSFPLSPDDRVLQKTPYTFDVSISELLWPLTAGARLVFADPDGHRDPAYLHHLVRREAITILHFVPSMLRVFTDYPGLETLTSIRLFALIGEPLPTSLASRVLSALPQAAMVNFYGPTEATIDVSAHLCSARDEEEGPIVAIGHPGWNTMFHVVDAHHRLVPIGVPGELAIGGAQLARFYLNRPDLTAERFIENPLGPGRLYLTGDRVRRRPDGEIDYLGRLDFQVKIRGMRVEIGEVESILRSCPGIIDACVVAREIGEELALVGYVSLEGKLDEAALSTWLAAALPEHMRPAKVISLETFPLTTSGKIDRKKLPDPQTLGRRDDTRAQAASPTEFMLLALWQEILGQRDFGCTDGFFDVGGTSLGAMRMAGLLAERTGRPVPVVALFRYPTIRALAAHLDAQDAGEEFSSPIQKARGRAASRQGLRATRS